jgi:hypothetical protein
MREENGEVFITFSHIDNLPPSIRAVWLTLPEELRRGFKWVLWYPKAHGRVEGEWTISFPLIEYAKQKHSNSNLAGSTEYIKCYRKRSSPGEPPRFHKRHARVDERSKIVQLGVGGKIRRVSLRPTDLIQSRSSH